MSTQIKTLLTYLDIIELASDLNCRLVLDTFNGLVDDLEFQIFNDYIENV